MLSRPSPIFWLIHPFIPILLAQSVHFFQNLLIKTLALARSLCHRCAASSRLRWRDECLFLLLSHRKQLVFYWSEEAGQAFACTSFSSAVRNSVSEQDKQGSVQQGATMYQDRKFPFKVNSSCLFYIYSSDCIFTFFFREQEGKKQIKSLKKQLQDVKKQTETELKVRSLSTGHHARGEAH